MNATNVFMSKEHQMIMLLFVDDVLIVGNNSIVIMTNKKNVR